MLRIGRKVYLDKIIYIFLLAIFTTNYSYSSEPFVNPIMSARLSSNYGLRIHPIKKYSSSHRGIDLAAPMDSPIRAAQKGIVVFADRYAGYGNLVVIRHKDGLTTHYGHCSTLLVEPGTFVRAGAIIARIGSTGTSTGPHLHFETRKNGIPLNPLKVFPDLLTPAKG
ncbi:MAG: M23 family metallopeptidase [Bdellovibrionota bacterium]